jgi:hypothetical protein
MIPMAMAMAMGDGQSWSMQKALLIRLDALGSAIQGRRLRALGARLEKDCSHSLERNKRVEPARSWGSLVVGVMNGRMIESGKCTLERKEGGSFICSWGQKLLGSPVTPHPS